MSRSTWAKWDPPLAGTFNYLTRIGASERDTLYKRPLSQRYAARLERHFSDKRKAAAKAAGRMP